MLKIKNLHDIIDLITSHKRGHKINITKAVTYTGESWTFYIDNKKTQKRKIITIKFDKDGYIYGTYNILKGYDHVHECWGDKKHSDRMSFELDDCGYFRFVKYTQDNLSCTRTDQAGNFYFAYYTLKNPLAL